MKKSVKKIGLCAITCAMLASYMSCINPSGPSNNETPSVENSANNDQGNNENNNQGSTNDSEDDNGSGSEDDSGNTGDNGSTGGNTGNGGNSEDNGDSGSSGPTAETIQEGWYAYFTGESQVNYIYYDANKNIVRVLSTQKELSGNELNNAKRTLAYDSIKENLEYCADIVKLPPWYFRSAVTIVSKDEANLYKGLSTSQSVRVKNEDGNITLTSLKGGEIYITPHYYDENGNEITSSKKPDITWSFEANESGVDFKKYFIPSRTEDGTFTLTMIAKPSENLTFTVKAFDKTIGNNDESKVIKFTLVALSI